VTLSGGDQEPAGQASSQDGLLARDRPPGETTGRIAKEAAAKFGALLRRARHRKALTQEQLAQHCDVGLRTIRRLEAGDFTTTRLQTAQKLADALGLGPRERDTFLSTITVGTAPVTTADEFGVLLRQTRQRKALTQEDFAQRAMVGIRTIQRLEAGNALGLTVATVRQLADALGLELGSSERDSFLRAAVDGDRGARHREPAPGY
jgi:transcriptional regulator with XRE-family HTH domain